MNDRPEEEHGDGEAPHLVVPGKGRIARRLRNYFLTGIVVIGPIGLTIWLTLQIVGLIDNTVRALVPARYENLLSSGIPGLGVVISVVGLMLVGFITANFLGRALLGYGEQLVDRMPIVRSLYGALKQIFETVLAQSSSSFREVVLVEYPRKGLWAMAFVTGGNTPATTKQTTATPTVIVLLTAKE